MSSTPGNPLSSLFPFHIPWETVEDSYERHPETPTNTLQGSGGNHPKTPSDEEYVERPPKTDQEFFEELGMFPWGAPEEYLEPGKQEDHN